MSLALGLALAGCVPPRSLPDREVHWVEATLTASGGSTLEGIYRHRTERGNGSVWRVVTDRTEGVVSAPRSPPLTFDSARPSAADPWPLVLQHAIAAVPAEVRLDDRGRPLSLLDPEHWAAQARQAVDQADVPGASADALIDPDGFVVNLARTFPGLPAAHEEWRRTERLAGLVAHRTERCGPKRRDGGHRVVRCEGSAVAEPSTRGDLFDTSCWTEVHWDAEGLLKVESGYSGTLITSGEGPDPVDLPIAGQRLLARER